MPSLFTAAGPPTLDTLNHCAAADFAAHLGGVFEHAAWVAAATAVRRPFASVDALHTAMLEMVLALPDAEQVALLCGHPELAGRDARAGTMTAESVHEQAGLLSAAPSDDSAGRWDALNAAYRARFGFPFILCIRRHGAESALAQFERRLGQDTATERGEALREIGRITRLRLAQRLADHGMQGIAGQLTTHVLDTAAGRPAAAVQVELHALDGAAGDQRRCIARGVTGADGRTPTPLFDGAPLPIGRYELHFHLGAYFHGHALHETASGAPPFLDVVPIAFGVAEPEGHYHLPITATPWSYATYRGH